MSPWLGSDMAIAYRKFDAGLGAINNDILMVLSSTNVLDATSRIEKVLKGQDLPQRETYRGITIYEGDKAAFARTGQDFAKIINAPDIDDPGAYLAFPIFAKHGNMREIVK